MAQLLGADDVLLLEAPHEVQHRVESRQVVLIQEAEQVASATLQIVASQINILGVEIIQDAFKVVQNLFGCVFK